MILFTILLCTILALALITGIIVLAGGSVFMLIACDLIVCIAIVVMLLKKKGS